MNNFLNYLTGDHGIPFWDLVHDFCSCRSRVVFLNHSDHFSDFIFIFEKAFQDVEKGVGPFFQLEMKPILAPFKIFKPDAIWKTFESSSWVGSRMVIVMSAFVHCGPQSRHTPRA